MGLRPQRWLSFFLLPLLLSFATAASANLTNHTIDDTDPSVTSANLGGLCRNCDFNQTELLPLYKGSATSLNPPVLDEPESTMVISFTGVAVYVYLAKPFGFPSNATFRLDGKSLASQFEASNEIAQYNDLALQAVNLASERHILEILRGQDATFYFDYYIFTSDDSAPNTTSVPSLATSATASRPSATSPLDTSHAPSRSESSVAAIAGGVVGGIVLLCVLLSVFLLCRRRRSRTTTSPAMIEAYAADNQAISKPRTGFLPPGPTKAGSQTPSSEGNENPFEVIRSLQENVQRLEQRLGEASAGEAGGLTRSLSTLKREQTRAVQDNQPTYDGTQTFTHTDSGLRLTAGGGGRGRVLEELPPTYEED
ncbi:hypothetical protein C8R45DRAFT_1209272 [Mycena sanguinolenta]|nr:hypothetical protein C8R45DRAFT_1209272 [Mycena sanguinolenta]